MLNLLDINNTKFWGILILIVVLAMIAGIAFGTPQDVIENKKAALEICKEQPTNPACQYYFPSKCQE